MRELKEQTKKDIRKIVKELKKSTSVKDFIKKIDWDKKLQPLRDEYWVSVDMVSCF